MATNSPNVENTDQTWIFTAAKQVNQIIRTSDAYVPPFIFASGFVGNVLTLFAITSKRSRRSSNRGNWNDSRILIFVLACLDLFVLVTFFCQWLFGDLGQLGLVRGRSAQRALCKAFATLLRMALMLSAWGITMISLDRAFVVTQVAKKGDTRLYYAVLSGVMVLVGLTLYGHMPVTFDLVLQQSGFYKCDMIRSPELKHLFYWFDCVVSSFLPCLLVILSNIKILWFLHKRNRQIDVEMIRNQAVSVRVQARVTRTLMLVTMLFVLLNLPYRILKPCSSLFRKSNLFTKKLVGLSLNTTYKFWFVNSAINFYCYMMSSGFRSDLRSVFKRGGSALSHTSSTG